MSKLKHGRVLASGYVSTLVEYYDFYVYNIAAGLVLGQVFFPGSSPFFALAAALGTNAVSYVMRPLGGLLFGRVGDRYGRKRTLVITLAGMGIVTGLIGVLPSYHSIGVLATVLLVLLRLAQGLFVGGEWGGAITLVLENAPKNRKTFYTGFAQMGSPTGLLLASLVFFAIGSLVTDEQLATIGWRIPFIAGVALIAIGLVVRAKLEETPEFAEAKANTVGDGSAAASRASAGQEAGLGTLFSQYWKPLVLGLFLTMSTSAFWLVNTFLVGYLNQTSEIYSTSQIAAIPALVGGAQVVFIIPIALLYDRFNIRHGFVIGAVTSAAMGFLIFYVAQVGVGFAYLALVLVVLGVTTDLLHVGFGALVPTQFPVRVRYTGAALDYNVGMAVSGGVVPALAALGVSVFGGSIYGAAAAAAVFPLLGGVAALLSKNTVNSGRYDKEPAVAVRNI